MNVANHGSRTAESLYLIDGVQTAQMEGVGVATNVFRRTPEGWRVSHTGYRRTFEATYNLGDLPGFKLSGPGVHTHK